MKTRYCLKIIFSCIALFVFSACNQDEINRLQKENEALKSKNRELEAQVAELSETEQNKFGKAADLLSNAKSAADYRKAEEAFASFAAKYPISSYLEQAQKKQDDAKTKAEQLEWIDDQRKSIKTAMENKDWNAASKTVWLIRKVISKEEYDGYVKKIDEEKNKPIKTTISRLAKAAQDDVYKLIGKRVELVGKNGLLSDTSKNILGLHDGNKEIQIYYGKDMEDYFLDNRFSPMSAQFKVIGRVSNQLDLFDIPMIIAEKIERIK